MSIATLLCVKDRFSLAGRGLVLLPDFAVPGGWEDRVETVRISTPDGAEFEASARFERTHFEIPDPEVAMDRRWRVVVVLPGLTEEDVPEGSQLFAVEELLQILTG